jgi:hypothetical protein
MSGGGGVGKGCNKLAIEDSCGDGYAHDASPCAVMCIEVFNQQQVALHRVEVG